MDYMFMGHKTLNQRKYKPMYKITFFLVRNWT